MNDLVLDSNARTLAFTLTLKGEAEPLAVEVAYAIEHDKRGTCILVREVRTSKIGSAFLIKRHLPNRPKVPDAITVCALRNLPPTSLARLRTV